MNKLNTSVSQLIATSYPELEGMSLICYLSDNNSTFSFGLFHTLVKGPLIKKLSRQCGSCLMCVGVTTDTRLCAMDGKGCGVMGRRCGR